MRLGLIICALGLDAGLSVVPAAPASAQDYFDCEHSPRCEAVQSRQCAPVRTLKDKIILVRLHRSAEEVEQTWAVLAGFEPHYCSRLGARGSIVRDFMRFKAKPDPKLAGDGCASSLACAESFVATMRERWERDDLDARIKADLESRARTTIKAAAPVVTDAQASDAVPPESWQTTIEPATPVSATMPAKASVRAAQSR